MTNLATPVSNTSTPDIVGEAHPSGNSSGYVSPLPGNSCYDLSPAIVAAFFDDSMSLSRSADDTVSPPRDTNVLPLSSDANLLLCGIESPSTVNTPSVSDDIEPVSLEINQISPSSDTSPCDTSTLPRHDLDTISPLLSPLYRDTSLLGSPTDRTLTPLQHTASDDTTVESILANQMLAPPMATPINQGQNVKDFESSSHKITPLPCYRNMATPYLKVHTKYV